MIFNLLMKTPDADEAALSGLVGHETPKDLTKAKEMLASVLEYGEYLTVQCDTKKETFTVLKKDPTRWN